MEGYTCNITVLCIVYTYIVPLRLRVVVLPYVSYPRLDQLSIPHQWIHWFSFFPIISFLFFSD